MCCACNEMYVLPRKVNDWLQEEMLPITMVIERALRSTASTSIMALWRKVYRPRL